MKESTKTKVMTEMKRMTARMTVMMMAETARMTVRMIAEIWG
jgi:hypothetical protein